MCGWIFIAASYWIGYNEGKASRGICNMESSRFMDAAKE
jgi:hypothetical protein